jgi:hypothetical protein
VVVGCCIFFLRVLAAGFIFLAISHMPRGPNCQSTVHRLQCVPGF